MNKLSTFMVVAISILLGFAAGYKIGDTRGFQDGYEYGYTFDCRDEIRSLKATHEDLKKAVDFTREKAYQVQEENSRLKHRESLLAQNPKLVEDSIRNASRVKFLEDSLAKNKVYGVRVDPYTGKLDDGVKKLLDAAGKGKK